MKKTLTVALLSLAMIALLPAQQKSAPKKDTGNAGARVVELDEQLANLVTADKGNCDKMAIDINGWTSKNSAELKTLHEQGAKRTDEQKKEFREKYMPRINASMQKMSDAVAPCAQNPKVKAALEKMNQ